MYILNFKEHKILHLLEESKYSREAINNYHRTEPKRLGVSQ